jgi:GntR family transcriptional regulator, arabinose operon transcriptional repressor
MANLELPKYEQVKRSLISDIEVGRWSPGASIPSEAQLLKRFSVSRPTLVRSLQDLVRDGYLFRRQGKGTFVAERAERQADGQQSQRVITLFTAPRQAVAEVGSPGEVLLGLMRGVQSVLGPAHVDLALRYTSVGALDDETRQYLDKSQPGVALLIEPSFSPQLRVELLRRRWTVWSVNEPWEDGNAVYIDQERAGYLATRYLIEKRHCSRIALLNGPTVDYWGFGARRKGYLAALQEAGIEADPRLIREGAHMIDTEAGRTMMRAVLDGAIKVDGAVGASDSKAIGAVVAAQECGLRVPEDLVIVGIDDILAAHANPPLPSVAMPFEAVGRRAAEEALRSVGGANGHSLAPIEIQLKPTLVER